MDAFARPKDKFRRRETAAGSATKGAAAGQLAPAGLSGVPANLDAMQQERPLVSLRTVLVGVLAALVVLALLAALVGVDDVAETLADADAGAVLGALAATATWLFAWGLSLRVSLGTLGVPVTRRRSVLVYASAAFLNNVTPFGQVGGEALSAAVVSRSTDAEYETGLSAVTAVDVVNLVPTPLLAAAGLLWLVVDGAWSPAVRIAVSAVLGVTLAVGLGATLVWRFRADVGRSVVRGTVGVVAAANGVTGRVLPVDLPRFAARVESYVRGLGRVLDDRRRLRRCLALSAVGWGALVGAFWCSLVAVGRPIPLALAAFVLPAGMVAIAVPLPGGVGGVEAALVGLLVGIGGVPLTAATAGVVVYRGATYWAPLVVGGVVTAVLTAERRGG